MGSSPPAQDRPRGPQERSPERPAERVSGRQPERAAESATEPQAERPGDGLDDHGGDASHLVTARAEGEQATVEILIPLCRQTEYEVAKAALWQWRTRWRREITYSFKSNLRRRVDAAPGGAAGPAGPKPGRPSRHEADEAGEGAGGGIEYAPTVWVIKASLRAIAELPREYSRRMIPDLVPRWGVIACVRDQYTDNGRGERQYGTKHFAVGAEVYAHPPLSRMRGGRSDAPLAYDRALFTGLHRQTKRFVTVMQPTMRFEDWRVGEISHPVVLHEFRTNGVWNFEGALEEARRISNQMNERIFHLKIDRTPTD